MVFRIEDKNFSLCFHFTNIIPLREIFLKEASRPPACRAGNDRKDFPRKDREESI